MLMVTLIAFQLLKMKPLNFQKLEMNPEHVKITGLAEKCGNLVVHQ